MAEAEKEDPEEQQSATFASRKSELKTSLIMKPLGATQESSRDEVPQEPITIKQTLVKPSFPKPMTQESPERSVGRGSWQSIQRVGTSIYGSDNLITDYQSGSFGNA